MAEKRVCPVPWCDHKRKPQSLAAFRSRSGERRLSCSDCRQAAQANGTLAQECLQCGNTFEPDRGYDRAFCARCRAHLHATSDSAWLVVRTPTNDGALWKGRYFGDDTFCDMLSDCELEAGTIVEHYEAWTLEKCYRVVGGPDGDQLVALSPEEHRPRGDGLIFFPGRL